MRQWVHAEVAAQRPQGMVEIMLKRAKVQDQKLIPLYLGEVIVTVIMVTGFKQTGRGCTAMYLRYKRNSYGCLHTYYYLNVIKSCICLRSWTDYSSYKL